MSNLPAMTEDQVELIKRTIAKNATNDELKLFLYRCKELGLDPLKPGQIFFIKYGTGPGTIVIGRDGFRSRAASTGLHTGTKVGLIRNDKGDCIGAWAEVYRKDWTEPAREEVSLDEYNTGKQQWAKMPSTMIKKVAEVAALRMAFPDQLSGLYSTDEMEQANQVTYAKNQHQQMIEKSLETTKATMEVLAKPIRQLEDSIRMPIKKMSDIEEEAAQETKREMTALNKEINKKRPATLKEAFRVPDGVKTEHVPGEYVAMCGRPGGAVLGLKIKDISEGDLMGFMKYLRTEASKEYLSTPEVMEFICEAEIYINHKNGKS